MLHDALRDPDAENELLTMLLGERALFERFAAALSLRRADTDEALAPDHPLVLAALGAIAVHGRLEAWLAGVERTEGPRPDPVEESAVRARIAR